MASGVTPINGIAVPVIGDAFNPAVDMAAIGNGFDSLVIPRFATTSARAAAITSPVQGQYADIAGTIGLYGLSRYDGAAWQWVAGGAWTSLTLSSGWSVVASGVQTPRYRRFAGKIELDGWAFYTGAISTTHIQLATAVTAVASALPANVGANARFPVYNSISLATNMFVELIADGRLFVIASASVTNPVVNFSGVSFADLTVG